jgi:hypothetical protein
MSATDEERSGSFLAGLATGLIGIAILHSLGYAYKDRNADLKYGKTGLPANCRALIKANVDGFEAKEYNLYEAFYSIDRNCGANGELWDYDP